MPERTLECRNLVKSFGGVRAVDDFSVSFEAAQVTALIGPNGAGKTTLFHLITGFLRPDAGEILYCGRRIDRLPPWQVARQGIGRLFQDVRVFGELSAQENLLLAFPRQLGENAAWSLLRRSEVLSRDQVNAEEARRLLDMAGLTAFASTPAEQLSYGQQKLLAFMRLLAAGTQVLLLDEPTAGIHPPMIPHVLDLIRKQASEGKTVVVIEHNMTVVLEVADWVNFMDEGQLVAFGSAPDVLGDPEVRATYLGLASPPM
jgi:ABC-type branched-subunit amino acid transport system ATPase component